MTNTERVQVATPAEAYLSWCDDVAEAVFPEIAHPRLVFLDIEGDALEVIAKRRGMPSEAVVPALIEVVGTRISRFSRKSAFSTIERDTARWLTGDPQLPPPSLPLLAVFSLAAERMSNGEGLAAHNYYGQLAKLLAITSDVAGDSYRAVAEDLWDSLDRWLRYQDGRRGRPVPFVIGSHRYVGRAMAQAVVRDTDRRRLEHFFLDFDFSPHSELTADQITPLLDDWLENARRAPSHLRRLWRENDVRPHIVEAVSSTLSAWDGQVSETDDLAVSRGRVRLSMAERRLVGGVNVGVVLTMPRSNEPRAAWLHTTNGRVEVALVPDRAGEMYISDLKHKVAPETLIGADFMLDDPVAGALRRLPRSLVVLRQDDLTGAWREISQVKLGDPVCLLVRSDYQLGDLLQEISGTDWTIHGAEETPGLPAGWQLIRGITVVGRPGRDVGALDDLNALIPITRSTLTLSGGVRIPRAGTPTYHCGAPPTVTAAANGEAFKVTLMDLYDPDCVVDVQDPWSSVDGAPLAINLAELDLDPGPYGILMTTSGPPREISFNLHRSDDGALNPGYRRLVHDVERPLSAMCADSEGDGPMLVEGIPLFTAGDVSSLATGSVPPRVPWWRRDRAYAQAAHHVSLPAPAADSCLYTGRHVERVETAELGKDGHARGTSFGICEGCGRTQRYQNNYWKNHRAWERNRSRESDSRKIPSLVVGRERELGTSLQWDLLFDVVVGLGGGDAALLRSVTRQVDPSSRFFHEFVTTMESLGHLEILRDPATMEVVEWETAPTAVVDVGERWVLVGHWTSSALDMVGKAGVHLDRETQVDAPSRLSGCASVEELIDVVPEAVVLERPGETLAAALPPLRAVMDELVVSHRPEALKVDRYDPARDAWIATPDMESPGAYRTGGYTRTYVVRTSDDISRGFARRVNVALAKHLAALLSPDSGPLIAHHPTDGSLIVPLGAPLPGLYGRAAVLGSGRAPRRRDVRDRGSFIVYQNVSSELAAHLYSLLGA